MVTLLAWMAQRFVSSKSPTMYASAASWRARTADDWNLRSFLNSEAISLTSLWNGSFLMRSSVLFWNLLISLRATVPGRNLCGFLTPPDWAACVFLACLWAMCFLGALPPVFFLAVYFVLAIFMFEGVWSLELLPLKTISNLLNLLISISKIIGCNWLNYDISPGTWDKCTKLLSDLCYRYILFGTIKCS